MQKTDSVENAARELMNHYQDAGPTWAAAVQAVKTNWVASFHVKWSEKLAAVKSRVQPL